MSQRLADVIVPLALDTAYSYAVPAGMELAPGAPVLRLDLIGEAAFTASLCIDDIDCFAHRPLFVRHCLYSSRDSSRVGG